MSGDPTDNNAKLFAQGYNGVLQPHFADGSYMKVGAPAGTWDPPTAATDVRAAVHRPPEHQRRRDAERRQRERGHLGALEEQDPGEHVPDHRSGRVPVGPAEHPQGLPVRHRLQAVLYVEAQAAAALALYLRAGKTPPSSLVNATTKDTTLNADIKSVYTKPIWVTKENMADTVVKDGAITVPPLCTGKLCQGVQGGRNPVEPGPGSGLALQAGPGLARFVEPRRRDAMTTTENGAEPLLRLKGVSKNFGPVQALSNVDLEIPAGQVTALVGDNGAGKSVMIKCIAGIHAPEHGQIFWEGKPVRIRTPREAAALGIETVYQDLALCNNLDIVQNMFLGRERLNERRLPGRGGDGEGGRGDALQPAR